MDKDALDAAVAAVIEAQRQIWQVWQNAPMSAAVDERLDFANGELVNIIEDLRPFSDLARNWTCPQAR